MGAPPPAPEGRSTADSTTYMTCAEYSDAGGPKRTCSPDVPLGAPWTFQLNGSPVVARLSLTTGGATEVNVEQTCRLPTGCLRLKLPGTDPGLTFDVIAPSASQIPAHVYAIFEVPSLDGSAPARRFRLGFDARWFSALPKKSTASVSVANLIAPPVQAPLDVTAELRFEGAPYPLNVTFGAATLSYPPVTAVDRVQEPPKEWDPIQGVLHFDPPPSILTARLTVWEGSPRRITVAVTGAGGSLVGGAFRVQKDNDRTLEVVTAAIDRMPSSATVNISLGSTISIGYQASGTISRLSGRYESFRTHPDEPPRLLLLADGLVEGLPASASVVATMSATPRITYSAGGTLARLRIFVQKHDAPSFAAELDARSIPAFVEVTKDNRSLHLRATEGATSQVPAPIGSIELKYSALGSFISPVPSEDHVIAFPNQGNERLSLKYSGLKSLDVEYQNADVHLAVAGAGPRRFIAHVTMGSLAVTATIADLPSFIDVDVKQSTGTVVYSASHSIASLAIDAVTPTATLAAIVTNVPKDFTLAYAFDATRTVDEFTSCCFTSVSWDATQAAGQPTGVFFDASAVVNTTPWDLTADFQDVPKRWSVDLSRTEPPANCRICAGTGNSYAWHAFDGGSIGRVAASITNHGSVRRPPASEAGRNHAYATRTPSGAFDADFLMTGVKSATFSQTAESMFSEGEVGIDLAMGNRQPFDASLRVVVDPTMSVDAFVRVAPLPDVMHIGLAGKKIEYTGNLSPDIYAIVLAGGPTFVAAAGSVPPLVNGVAIIVENAWPETELRNGVAARAYLTGAPSRVTMDPDAGAYGLSGWQPRSADPGLIDCNPCPDFSAVEVRVAMDRPRITAQAFITPPSNPLSMGIQFQPIPLYVSYIGSQTIPRIVAAVHKADGPLPRTRISRINVTAEGIPPNATFTTGADGNVFFDAHGSTLDYVDIVLSDGTLPFVPLPPGELGIRVYDTVRQFYLNGRMTNVQKLEVVRSSSCTTPQIILGPQGNSTTMSTCTSRAQVHLNTTTYHNVRVDIQTPRKDYLGEPRADKNDIFEGWLTKLPPRVSFGLTSEVFEVVYKDAEGTKTGAESTTRLTDLGYSGRAPDGSPPDTAGSRLDLRVESGHDGEFMDVHAIPLAADLQLCSAPRDGRCTSGSSRDANKGSVFAKASQRFFLDITHCVRETTLCSTGAGGYKDLMLVKLNLTEVAFERNEPGVPSVWPTEHVYLHTGGQGTTVDGTFTSEHRIWQQGIKVKFPAGFWADHRVLNFNRSTLENVTSGSIGCPSGTEIFIVVANIWINLAKILCGW